MKKIKKLTAVFLTVLIVMSAFSVVSFAADSECTEHNVYTTHIDGAWYDVCDSCDYRECVCEYNGWETDCDRNGCYRICENCGKRNLYCDHSEYEYIQSYYGYFYCEVTESCDCGQAVISGTKHQLEYDSENHCFACTLCGEKVGIWSLEEEYNYITDNGDGTYSGEWVSYDYETGAVIGSGEVTLNKDGLLSFTGEGTIDFEGTDGGKAWELDKTLYTKECPYCTVGEYDWDEETGKEIYIGEKPGTHYITLMSTVKNISFGEGITKIKGISYLVSTDSISGYLYAESIELPSSLTAIEDLLVAYGTEIEIPENYKPDADSGIMIIAEKLTVDEANPYLSVDENGNIYSKDKTVLYKYKGTETAFTVPDAVKEIGAYAFVDNTLEKIILPEGVKKIGDSAFSSCFALEEIEIPDTVTEIGESAFNDCVSLKEVILPDGLTEINRYLFDGCWSLETVVVPSSVKEVGYYVFDDLFALKEIYIYSDDVDWFGDEHGNSAGLGMLGMTMSDEVRSEALSLYYDMLKMALGYIEWDKEKYDSFYECQSCYYNQIMTVANQFEGITNYDEDIPSELLTIYCNEGSTAVDYAEAKGIKYETGICEHTYGEWVTDEAKGIRYKVCSKCGKVVEEDADSTGDDITVGGYDGENKFIIEIIDDPENTEYIYVRGLVEGNIVGLYDINLLDENGNRVQPEGKVKIYLPLESDVVYFTVLRINGDGTYTDMKAVREGDGIVFETDHFSYYVILGGETKEDTGDSSRCDCICHTHPVLEFIFKVLKIVAKLFGGPTELFCDC